MTDYCENQIYELYLIVESVDEKSNYHVISTFSL